MSDDHRLAEPIGGASVAPPAVQTVPTTAGWASAAMAVHAVRRMPDPVLLRLDVIGSGSVTIDPRFHAWAGEFALADFPVDPPAVVIETRPAPPDGRPVFDLPGDDLDGLLWRIGTAAFGDAPATWRWPDDRYHLTRWPSLAQLPITVDEVRMLAMLANAFASPAELADAAGCELAAAERVVNGLSLIGILETSSAAPPPQPAPPRHATRGLLRRLRDRLGI